MTGRVSEEKRPPAWSEEAVTRLAWWRGRPVVLAVSGGADSVALLRLASTWAGRLDLQLVVAHMHHGVRPEADADAAFVAELAGRHGVPYEQEMWSPVRTGHFEADARRARYAWLAEIGASRGTPAAVAVAHTWDDQAETILHRVIRGTGLRGLGGMARRRDLAAEVALIRPLLHVRRAEIVAYLAELGQSWRDDATNADTTRTRSRLRNVLLPELSRSYNPRAAEALVRLGRMARAEHRLVERWAERRAARDWRPTEGGGMATEVVSLRAIAKILQVEVIRAAWRSAGWPERAMGEAAWGRVAVLAGQERGAIVLPGGYRARHEAGRLVIEPAAEAREAMPEEAWLSLPGSVVWCGVEVRVAESVDGCVMPELIDVDRVEPFELEGRPVLRVRGARPGDRFAPLGLDGHSRRLVEFLRERGVRPDERGRVPLVCDRAGIVWVAGHRIAERVRLREGTRRVLGLELRSAR